MIVLDDGRARVEVHPDNGAAIGRYDLIDRSGDVGDEADGGEHQ